MNSHGEHRCTADGDVTVEVGTLDDRVVLVFALDGDTLPFWLDPDAARGLCNSIGAALKFLRTGVVAG